MTAWRDLPSITVPLALEAAVVGHPLVARILAHRGLSNPKTARAFLDPAWYRPAPPDDLPGVPEAVELLLEARGEGRRVCVWGDFDVDGQTATALLVQGLTHLGMDVVYYIPDRATEGHGLSAAALREVIRQGANLILTCDCGVADHEEIAMAQRMGARVIVTDHHELPGDLPAADAVINPQRLPAGHPLSYLCGVGVAYALLSAVHDAMSRGGQEEEWLDLVALGTIADVAILLDDNRHLVQRGLPRLLYKPRPGIEAIFRTAGTAPPELLDTEVVSFTLAPRLNAVGRLAHASSAMRLLLTDDGEEALKLAAELEIYNDHRRRLCDEIEAQAEDMLRRQPELLALPALVLSGSNWHPGVIGIIASRLAERYGTPTILISTPPGEVGRASARSVPGLHIQKAISRHQDLLLGGGGHRMAAGFTIHPWQIPAFQESFQITVGEMLPEETRLAGLALDGYLSLDEVTPMLVEELYRLAPFGPGNPQPVLACRQVKLANVAGLGMADAHARLIIEDRTGARVPAIWWRTPPEQVPSGWVDVAFTVGLDEYSTEPTARLSLVAVRSGLPQQVTVEEVHPKLPFAVGDWRGAADRQQILQALLQEYSDASQVWAEGPGAKDVPRARNRTHLQPGTDLVIWTIPPGPKELREVLARVRPQRVHLLTGEVTQETPADFLRGLADAVRYILSHQAGHTSLEELAAMTGHRTATVEQGLRLLAVKGKLNYREVAGQIYITGRGGEPSGELASDDLKRLLQETAAYRRYFTGATPHYLLRMAD